uniref:AAA+ ATPase domain-containing protein n=1 Tax=Ditylum brightwellii TaxID=49249 RepID=A0A7S2ED27_9STRA|mmetsp:Transcript_24301/g.36234  ORF Transcript_24301/g.36234 Transcript_24301/m.36234 type:complete len:650 (+) Transcript_24301:174-2123(+)
MKLSAHFVCLLTHTLCTAAYLSKLTQSIQNNQTIPFPTKNPMYNFNSTSSSTSSTQQQQHGQVVPLHICLVGIVTCDDAIGSAQKSSSNPSHTILDLFGTNGTTRFRLSSTLSNSTRVQAFLYAFQKQHIQLEQQTKESREEFEMMIVPSTVEYARGTFFKRVARKLRSLVFYRMTHCGSGGGRKEEDDGSMVVNATLEDVKLALYCIQNDVHVASSGVNHAIRTATAQTRTQVSFLSNVSPKTGRFKANHNNKDNLSTNTSSSSSSIVTTQPSTKEHKDNDIFASVGGNSEAKIALKDALALDKTQKILLAKFGLSAPTGVLLYGPPGTGKTLLAKATAFALQSSSDDENDTSNTSSSKNTFEKRVGGAFISLRATDIVQSEIGSSEKILVSAFETARRNAPSVIFIDEFQALFTERGGGGGGGSSSGSGRLASTLLQCMDDVTSWRDADSAALRQSTTSNNESSKEEKSSRVVIFGATNTPWMIDKAFLRPGRFDQVVHVGLPNLKERESILRVHVSRMKIQHNVGGVVASNHEDCFYSSSSLSSSLSLSSSAVAASRKANVDKICKRMAKECDGFSGADIAALCRASAIRCLREKKNGEKEKKKKNDSINEQLGYICERHFVEARMQDVNRSSNDELVKQISNWRP